MAEDQQLSKGAWCLVSPSITPVPPEPTQSGTGGQTAPPDIDVWEEGNGQWQDPVASLSSSSPSAGGSNETNVRFRPRVAAWMCALFFTSIEATMSPLFLFRSYSMPITPLLIPALVYPICSWKNASEPDASNTVGSDDRDCQLERTRVLGIGIPLKLVARIRQWIVWWRRRLGLEMFSREEMVWITAVVAAGGGFAPAYQWLATIDMYFGKPLTQWQQLAVVLSTQLFGWSLGCLLRHILIGNRKGIVWPDTLPLSYMIQALYLPGGKNPHAQHRDSNITISRDYVECGQSASAGEAKHGASEEPVCPDGLDIGAATTSKYRLMLLGVATFVYQIIISYIVPILKSLCLLCLWAPQSKLASLLGSGWNGTGILSLTFDWEALGTLQPLITPLWAQCQYYAGALLMTYVLTPIGWHLDWWGSQSLPIVSTNVFDTMGNAYNISLVHKFRNPDIDLSVHRLATYAPGLFKYKAYSPVRLTVNSALGYICAVAAITAVIIHLALWHPQWLRQAVLDMAHALLRLWDPRTLFRTVRTERAERTELQTDKCANGVRATADGAEGEGVGQQVVWDIGYVVGRVGRILIFTVAVGIAFLSKQIGISALPGWQTLIAICWAICMCVPVGYIEAVTGFTLPMDLIPHMFGGVMQGPGTPIETSYFHLWATVPIRVALGWTGVRSFQLAHHCCPQVRYEARATRRQRRVRTLLPWLRRGLLIGIVWGACINHLSYTVFSRSFDDGSVLPIERDTSIEDLPNPDILLVSSFDMSEFNSQELEDYLDNDGEVSSGLDVEPPEIDSPILGWHEPGEFGRLPAALSSEMVVWGVIGPQSLFSAESPYRMLFVYGALLGALLPPLFFLAHHVFERLARMASERNSMARGWWGLLARAAKAVQVPLVLTGMVAVPTMPANFVLSGLAIAVGGQLWLRSRNKSLVDLSLYSAVLYLGTQMAIVGMFIVGEILTAEHVPLSFVRWWGNQLENVEHCADV